MKNITALLILGALLLILAFSLAAAASRPLTGLSPLGEVTMTTSMVLGLLLIGVASVLHLKGHAK